MPDDYFAATRPLETLAPPQQPVPPLSVQRRPKPALVLGLVIAIALGAFGASRLARSSRPVDPRPIAVPPSIGGIPLRTDAVSEQHRESMQPILTKIFGKQPATSAQYSTGRGRVPAVNLLVGRGPIDKARTGDVAETAKERVRYGDVTCAHMQLGKQVIKSVIVCWYSSADFGASILALGWPSSDMQAMATALDAVIPSMRDGAT
jgi:hypothetical protein